MIRFVFIVIACLLFTKVHAEEWKDNLKLPFSSDKLIPRESFDIRKNFDLSTTDEVHVTLSIDMPEAVGMVTLYFRSANGWYSMDGDLKSIGRQTLVFPLSHRKSEGQPGGLDTIDQLRLSFWRGRGVDTAVELHGWELVSYPVVIVNPTELSPDARITAQQLRALDASAGIRLGTLDQSSLTAEALKDRRVVILLQNTILTEQQISLLKDYIESGGKLLAFYRLPDELMQTLGLTPGTQVQPPEGTDPLTSERGAVFVQFSRADNADAQRGAVLTFLTKWSPDLWTHAMERLINNLYTIGKMPYETEAEKSARIADIDLKIESFAESRDARRFCMEFSALRQEVIEDYIRSLPSEPGERRLWWEHAGTGAYPGDWDRTMKELKEHGFNAVIPNMLWGGVAHYDSKVLPHSRIFEQYGDQIEQAVRAGKKYGVEVHVWKVNFNLSHRSPQEFVDAMRQADRLQVRFDGRVDDNPTYRIWLCPSHPENRNLERESLVEIVKNYDVDGIHFDYIRYPNNEHCYCKGCKERFENHVGETIADWPQATRNAQWKTKFDDWRCDQITALVADVHREVKKVKPSIKISAAVFSRYPGSRVEVLQDWLHWVEKGYLDFICPMDYTANIAAFDALIEEQTNIVAGRVPIYPGIGASTNLDNSPERVAAQIMVTRKYGTKGFTIFNLSRDSITKIPPVLSLGPTKP